jgi:hypothetical protein
MRTTQLETLPGLLEEKELQAAQGGNIRKRDASAVVKVKISVNRQIAFS